MAACMKKSDDRPQLPLVLPNKSNPNIVSFVEKENIDLLVIGQYKKGKRRGLAGKNTVVM